MGCPKRFTPYSHLFQQNREIMGLVNKNNVGVSTTPEMTSPILSFSFYLWSLETLVLQIPNQLFFSALKTRFSASDTELYVGITGTIVLKNSNVKKIFCMYDSYVDLRC
jgi:hypothetical protein